MKSLRHKEVKEEEINLIYPDVNYIKTLSKEFVQKISIVKTIDLGKVNQGIRKKSKH